MAGVTESSHFLAVITGGEHYCRWQKDPSGWPSVHALSIQHVPTEQSGRPVLPWGTGNHLVHHFCTGVESLAYRPLHVLPQYSCAAGAIGRLTMAQLPRGSAYGF